MPEKTISITIVRPCVVNGANRAASDVIQVNEGLARHMVRIGDATITAISAPTVSGLTPNTIAAGSGLVPIVIVGTNFKENSLVLFNDALVTTHYVSPTQLIAVPSITGLAADDYDVLVRSYKLDAAGAYEAVNQVAAATFTIS